MKNDNRYPEIDALLRSPPPGIKSISIHPSLTCPGACLAVVNNVKSPVFYTEADMAPWILAEVEQQRTDKPAPETGVDKVIAIDFDGTVCENAWPLIGEPKWDIIARAWAEQRQGAKLILWTCREGPVLEDAIIWCWEHDLFFDAVNENLPERIAQYNSNPRKIGAEEYWDDRAKPI